MKQKIAMEEQRSRAKGKQNYRVIEASRATEQYSTRAN